MPGTADVLPDVVPFLRTIIPVAEVVDVLKKIVEVYAARAKPLERLGEWIERIGWEAFFGAPKYPLPGNISTSYQCGGDV